MDTNLTDLSLHDLLALQEDLATAIRRKLAAADEPDSTIPEVIRVGMRRYRASVASVAPQAKKQTLLQTHSRCVLVISLRSDNSAGAKFEGCVRWIAENFDECALAVCDSIFRYTLRVGGDITTDAAEAQALELGREFIARHERMVERYTDRCRFEWMSAAQLSDADNFTRYLVDFRELYEHGPAFRAVVDEFGAKYLGRFLHRADSISASDVADKERLVREYLIEESALFTVLCEQGWDVLVYPGAIKTFVDIAEGQIPNIPEPLRKLVFVALRLNRGGLYFADSPEHADAAQAPDGDTDEDNVVGQGVLADLDADDWKRFMKYTERRTCMAGDILARADDNSERSLFIVLDGTLEVLLGDIDGDGTLQQVALRGPGSVLGEQSFVDGQPRSATVAALGECEILVLKPKQLTRMRDRDPDLASALLFDISRVLSLRIRWS